MHNTEQNALPLSRPVSPSCQDGIGSSGSARTQKKEWLEDHSWWYEKKFCHVPLSFVDMAVIECLVYSEVWNSRNSFLGSVVSIYLMIREIWCGSDNRISVLEIVVGLWRDRASLPLMTSVLPTSIVRTCALVVITARRSSSTSKPGLSVRTKSQMTISAW